MNTTAHSRENCIHDFNSISVIINEARTQEAKDQMGLHHIPVNGYLVFSGDY